LTAVDLVVGAPVPSKHRQRKPSPATTLKRLLKAGIAATGATVAPDGSVSVALGGLATQPNDGAKELEDWIAKHADQAKGS
jgi:hypothetical protein